MKFSQFNTFQPFEGKMLAYNAYNDSFLLLEHTLYNLIEVAATTKHPEDINEVHPAFYNALIKRGFIVETGTDEIEKVRLMMEEVNGRNDFYRLIINPTMNCNFKCWYCYETHIKESKMEEETLEKTKKFIKNVIETNPGLQLLALSFFGGEPLLYYQKIVVPILEYTTQLAAQHNVKVNTDFTTNGFLINPDMLESFKLLNVNNFQITLDGDEEHHNLVRFVSKSRGSYREIVNNIILLAKNRFEVTLRINYTKENLNGIESIIADFDGLDEETKKQITVSPHQVWQDGNRDLGPRVDEFIKLVKMLGFSTIHSKMGDTVRYSCYADKKNHATINYNGEVFKCTARDFTSANKEGILTDNGEIEWEEKHAKRWTSRLKNPPCLECAILPICGGGCSQKAMENEKKEYCVNFFDENLKKAIVMDRFLDAANDELEQKQLQAAG